MQQATAPPRDGLTAAQVEQVIRAGTLTVTAGAQLVDSGGNVTETIDDDIHQVDIEHGTYRTVHRTCRLRLSRPLLWGRQRIRPTVTLTDGTTTVTFHCGVFLLSTPTRHGRDGTMFEVDGTDLLELVNSPHGEGFHLETGDGILDAVETLIAAAGGTASLDQTKASVTASTSKSWPFDPDMTTLQLCNRLLTLVGYRALWVDADGLFRSGPYESPATRGAEWTYDADADDTIVGEERTLVEDLWSAPNRWVGYLSDPSGGLPVDGAGRYAVTNQADGPASIDARDGRVVTKVVPVDAETHADLVAAVDRIVERDKSAARADLMWTATVNPLHGHADVVAYSDARLGLSSAKVAVHRWRYEAPSGRMTVEGRVVT